MNLPWQDQWADGLLGIRKESPCGRRVAC